MIDDVSVKLCSGDFAIDTHIPDDSGNCASFRKAPCFGPVSHHKRPGAAANLASATRLSAPACVGDAAPSPPEIHGCGYD